MVGDSSQGANGVVALRLRMEPYFHGLACSHASEAGVLALHLLP
jgi:hypothetical protein